MELLKTFFETLDLNDNPLDDRLKKLKDSIDTKKVKKGTILQFQGDYNSNAYYVKSGMLRSYIIDEKGKEHIFMFAPEGWIISDVESNISDDPCHLFIDVIEDAEIEIIDKQLLRSGLLSSKELEIQFGKLMNRIAVLQKRVILLMSATAYQRYQDFLQTYTNISNRVPQKMIASYLGITPEALSKIRSQKHKS